MECALVGLWRDRYMLLIRDKRAFQNLACPAGFFVSKLWCFLLKNGISASPTIALLVEKPRERGDESYTKILV